VCARACVRLSGDITALHDSLLAARGFVNVHEVISFATISVIANATHSRIIIPPTVAYREGGNKRCFCPSVRRIHSE